MLGKALNDPIKGITALSRAGVTFTQGQKDQIKTLVESGNLLGAQKIIMGELEAQVGGTAEATATAGDKMAATWANFQENLGTAVLPILDGLLTQADARPRVGRAEPRHRRRSSSRLRPASGC